MPAVVKRCRDLLRSGVYPDLVRIPLPLLGETTPGREPKEERNGGAARGRSSRKIGREDGREEEEVRAALRLRLLFMFLLLFMLYYGSVP